MLSLALLLAQIPPPMTAQEDHARLLRELGIERLRPGKDGMNPKNPNFANTEEAKSNPYPNIPNLMTFADGRAVKSRGDWTRRRSEIIELLDREIYGRTPKRTPGVTWELLNSEEKNFGGIAAISQKWVGRVDNRSCPEIKVDIQLSLTFPEKAERKSPVILEFGFIFPRRPGTAPVAPPPPPAWQVDVLKRGWGFAILDPNSVQADNGGGLNRGIIGLVNKGKARKPDDWGALKAWAWGAGRCLDLFAKNPKIDAKKVAIEGISRYGKAAAVTMAYDQRFASALIGSSGQGGIKIWRRDNGETVENVASSGEYHWMAGNYVKYAGPLTPGDMPVDAHQLLALCAPRPTFVGIGSPKVEGIWIDLVGTFMATKLASPAWELLGKKGLSVSELPPEGTPAIEGDLAFSGHTGGHTNVPNFPVFFDFCARYWDKK